MSYHGSNVVNAKHYLGGDVVPPRLVARVLGGVHEKKGCCSPGAKPCAPCAPRLGRYGVHGLGSDVKKPGFSSTRSSIPQTLLDKWNNNLRQMIAPVAGGFSALPFSEADKTKLRNRPLDFLINLFDPVEDFVATTISEVIARTGGNPLRQYFDKLVDLRRDQPGDAKYDASTLNLLRRLRTINGCFVLMLNQPIIFPTALAARLIRSGDEDVAVHLITANIPTGAVLEASLSPQADVALRTRGWIPGGQTTDGGADVWTFEIPNTFSIGGQGSATDPFGGIGGASASTLQSLAKNGITFANPPGGVNDKFQVGEFNREKYVYVKGSDGNFYKFKMTGTGIGNTPSNAAAQTWFNAVVGSANPVVPANERGIRFFGPSDSAFTRTRFFVNKAAAIAAAKAAAQAKNAVSGIGHYISGRGSYGGAGGLGVSEIAAGILAWLEGLSDLIGNSVVTAIIGVIGEIVTLVDGLIASALTAAGGVFAANLGIKSATGIDLLNEGRKATFGPNDDEKKAKADADALAAAQACARSGGVLDAFGVCQKHKEPSNIGPASTPGSDASTQSSSTTASGIPTAAILGGAALLAFFFLRRR